MSEHWTWIWRSRIWIALGLVAIHRSQFYFSKAIDSWSWEYAFFIFSACIWAYQVHYVKDTINRIALRGKLCIQHFYKLFLLSGGITLLIWSLSLDILDRLFLPAILTALYLAHNLLDHDGLKRPSIKKIISLVSPFLLKRWIILKPLTIALVWVLLTRTPDFFDFTVLTAHFFYIFSIALFFDLKNPEIDAGQQVVTIANRYGLQVNFYLSLSMATVSWIMFLLLSKSVVALFLAFFFMLSFASYRKIPEKWKEAYFYGLTDGLLFLPWILTLTMKNGPWTIEV